MPRVATFLLVLYAALPPARADTILLSGAYEIEFRLEMPAVQDTNPRQVRRLCLGSDRSENFGMIVLSDNNPLSKCPSSGTARAAASLTFEIACPGLNAARGQAVYDLGPDHFTGRIEMKMGGKNMTMTEHQVGRRIGACDTP